MCIKIEGIIHDHFCTRVLLRVVGGARAVLEKEQFHNGVLDLAGCAHVGMISTACSLAALALLQSVVKIETVWGNYEGFAKRKVKKAVLARKA